MIRETLEEIASRLDVRKQMMRMYERDCQDKVEKLQQGAQPDSMLLKGLNEWCHRVAHRVKLRGFETPTSYHQREAILAKLMLVITELAEAAEDIRNGRDEHFPEEIADTIIRLGDLVGALGIDIEQALLVKEDVNAGRPKKHGKLL